MDKSIQYQEDKIMSESVFTATLLIIEVIFSVMLLKTLKKSGGCSSLPIILAGVFIVWLVSTYLMITNGFYSSTGMPQVAFTLGVVIPVVLGLLVAKFWKPLGRAIDNMSASDFLALQHMRAVFGVMFFFTAALPVWFQYLGGLGDIAAGVGAFFALRYLKKNPDMERKANIKGNLVGILDFVIVLNVGVMVVLDGHSPDMVFNLIPLYVVPLFILLHIFSLQKLRATRRICNEYATD